MDGLRSVNTDESNALAGAQEQRVSVYDSLHILKLAGRYTWIWWIKESGEERNENEAGKRPFPVESAERETGVHGDAFSTSAMKASRQRPRLLGRLGVRRMGSGRNDAK
jgi:hypothetical protein